MGITCAITHYVIYAKYIDSSSRSISLRPGPVPSMLPLQVMRLYSSSSEKRRYATNVSSGSFADRCVRDEVTVGSSPTLAAWFQ